MALEGRAGREREKERELKFKSRNSCNKTKERNGGEEKEGAKEEKAIRFSNENGKCREGKMKRVK